MIRICIITHRIFAEHGSNNIFEEWSDNSQKRFSKSRLEAILSLLENLDMADRRKMSDLSVTLTGDAWIRRLLAGNVNKYVSDFGIKCTQIDEDRDILVERANSFRGCRACRSICSSGRGYFGKQSCPANFS